RAVADSPNLVNALRFVRFAARPESMAGVGRYIAYSPTRESGRALVTHHAETGVEMAPHLPAYPANTKRRLINNDEFWANHLDELNERFSAWLAR
ncbi:MAG: ABC transporter substrate-binding protein, partial [Pseudomonadales bacterium]|nr:ABC transporter substrate-binding protein [Pseudomonadales bacterium]